MTAASETQLTEEAILGAGFKKHLHQMSGISYFHPDWRADGNVYPKVVAVYNSWNGSLRSVRIGEDETIQHYDGRIGALQWKLVTVKDFNKWFSTFVPLNCDLV